MIYVRRRVDPTTKAFQVTMEMIEKAIFEGEKLPYPVILGLVNARWIDRHVYAVRMYLDPDKNLTTTMVRSRLQAWRIVWPNDWIVEEGGKWVVYRPEEFQQVYEVEN